MGEDLDTAVYMMACEKMINLLFVMENTLEFLTEYKVKPDEEVKKALVPLIKQLNDWSAK
jgi:hypothetical protein